MRRQVRSQLLRGAAAIATALLCVCAAPAGAESGAGGGPGDPWVWVGQPGEHFPGGAAGGSGGLTCRLYEGGGLSSIGPIVFGDQVTDPIPGERYLLFCRDAAGSPVILRSIVYDPSDWQSAASLAAQAYRQLPLVYPDPHMAPDRDVAHLVGVATWLWLPADEWTARRATASIPGLSATVTAIPVRAIWDMGDGSRVVCRGPGRPWDPSAPPASSDCSKTYERDSTAEAGGVFVVSVQIVWAVSWTATDGSGGPLPDAWRGTRFTLVVGEVQAVVDR